MRRSPSFRPARIGSRCCRFATTPSTWAAARGRGVPGCWRVRASLIERIKAGEHLGILGHAAARGRVVALVPTLASCPVGQQAMGHLMKALELYESAGDGHGAMSVIIAM